MVGDAWHGSLVQGLRNCLGSLAVLGLSPPLPSTPEAGHGRTLGPGVSGWILGAGTHAGQAFISALL